MRRVLKRIGQVLLVIFAALLAAYSIAALTARPAPAHPWFARRPNEHTPLVFAHQGGEDIRPSNTLEAFGHAVALGADVLDTDMHITRDGVLVLMHDRTVDRTTDGTGAIRELTIDQIKELDAGYRFTLDDGKTFPYRGQGLTVPTLEELLTAFPDKRFGVEMKPPELGIAEPFCAALRKYNMQNQVLVSSFRQENMDAFRKACPEVATSATQNEVILFFAFNTLRLTRAYTPNYNSLQVPEEQSGILVLTPHFVAGARSRGLAVQPWTIDEEQDLRRILALGVDAINTNRPDRLLEMLKSQ
jgi:glycerophosphoryl diester phosphodiesterase